MSVRSGLDEDDELLAAEFAFGLLEETERVAIERRAERDRAFTVRLSWWQDHVASMAMSEGSPPPPAVIWSRIEARLPSGKTDERRTPMRGWLLSTIAAAAASLAIGIGIGEWLASPPPVAPSPPPLVAVMNGSENVAVLAITVDPVASRIIAAPLQLHVGRHSAQLWVIPSGGKPISLGLIAPNKPAVIGVPSSGSPALLPGASIALSVEPLGGSPTGQPTGAIILKGQLSTS